MDPKTKRAWTLGLSFMAALGLMAVATAGAQANWLVEGVELTENETVKVEALTPFTLTVPAKKLEINCTTVASKNYKLIGKSATAEGELEISGCTSFSTGVEQKNCKPGEPIKIALKSLLILHNSISYLLDEPTAAGNKFATIVFGELCAITETADLKGSIVLECGHLNPPGTWLILDCKNSEVTHLVRVAPAALFTSDSIIFGLSQAAVADATRVNLSGARTGKPWGGQI